MSEKNKQVLSLVGKTNPSEGAMCAAEIEESLKTIDEFRGRVERGEIASFALGGTMSRETDIIQITSCPYLDFYGLIGVLQSLQQELIWDYHIDNEESA